MHNNEAFLRAHVTHRHEGLHQAAVSDPTVPRHAGHRSRKWRRTKGTT